jgi:hypothetical protein
MDSTLLRKMQADVASADWFAGASADEAFSRWHGASSSSSSKQQNKNQKTMIILKESEIKNQEWWLFGCPFFFSFF